MGIDPGLGYTAIVLLADGRPVAAAAARNKETASPIQYRTQKLALWVGETAQAWVHQHKIVVLDVIIETPVLNVTRKNVGNKCPVCKKPFKGNERGVTTLDKQVRLLAAIEMMLFRLEGCVYRLGEVHNQTVKQLFAGTGKATKDVMVACSQWSKRPDVKEREHLADAQAIGTCYPVMIDMVEEDLIASIPTYEDHAIGKGEQWKTSTQLPRSQRQKAQRLARTRTTNTKKR